MNEPSLSVQLSEHPPFCIVHSFMSEIIQIVYLPYNNYTVSLQVKLLFWYLVDIIRSVYSEILINDRPFIERFCGHYYTLVLYPWCLLWDSTEKLQGNNCCGFALPWITYCDFAIWLAGEYAYNYILWLRNLNGWHVQKTKTLNDLGSPPLCSQAP